MFKTLAVIVAIVLLLLLAFAATRPDSFQVERSTTIKAPPDKAFALVQDFHKWAEWSPWEKLDPAMKRTFSGAAAGRGAVYAWDGSGKAGAGRMEILESAPSSKVLIKLDFIKPFEGHNTAEFTLKPQGDSTLVIWRMQGPAPFISKLMGIFFDMDKLIGSDFETGLNNLKTLSEK